MGRGYAVATVCTVRQIEDYHQPAERSFPRCLDIVVDFELVQLVPETDGDKPLSPAFLVPFVCRDGTKTFRFDVDQLLHAHSAKWTVWNMLLDIGVAGCEQHDYMADEILRFAAEMARDERNRGLHILPMGVSITCLASWFISREPAASVSRSDDEDDGMTMSEDEDEDEDVDEDEDEDEFTSMDGAYDDAMAGTTTVPRSHESFEEKLKNVMILEGEERCVICSEDICVGSSATCMPCSHVYHGDCIRKWLVPKRSCPLC